MSRDQPRDIRLVNRDPYIGLLVGRFNPSKKYESNSIMFPSFLGVNIKHFSKLPLIVESWYPIRKKITNWNKSKSWDHHCKFETTVYNRYIAQPTRVKWRYDPSFSPSFPSSWPVGDLRYIPPWHSQDRRWAPDEKNQPVTHGPWWDSTGSGGSIHLQIYYKKSSKSLEFNDRREFK